MSGEALYERYKDALKRGHVASLRGQIDEALAAYGEAAVIAPERSTPHTSAGTALMRRKRPADALRQYEAALRLGPQDVAAMLGRAQALAVLGRRAAAADAFDALADVQASSGRLADAVEAARRGLELAEGRHRRRSLEGLIERLRASEPDEPGRMALERALQVLDGPALPTQTRVPEASVEPVAEDGGAGEASVEADSAAEPEQEPELVVPRVLDRTVPEPVDLEVLAQDVEAALASGDPSASERFLDLVAAAYREGRINAALDACYQALSLFPDNADLHLALVQLYDREGWAALASEKLDLLARLAVLSDDPDAGARVASARSTRG